MNFSPDKRSQFPVGKLFLNSGQITPDQLEAALDFKRRHGGKLGQALVALKIVTESQLAEILKMQGKVHTVHLTREIIDSAVLAQFGAQMARRFQAVALNRIAGYVTVAMEDPSDLHAVGEIVRHMGNRVLPVYAEPGRIDSIIDAFFPEEEEETEKRAEPRSTEDWAAIDLTFDDSAQEGEEEEPASATAPAPAPAPAEEDPWQAETAKVPPTPEKTEEGLSKPLEATPFAPSVGLDKTQSSEGDEAELVEFGDYLSRVDLKRPPVSSGEAKREFEGAQLGMDEDDLTPPQPDEPEVVEEEFEAAEIDFETAVAEFIEDALQQACQHKATDIHLEPRQEDLLMRFRMGGALLDRGTVPKAWERYVLEYVKCLVGLDKEQVQVPQTGQGVYRHEDHRIELRVSTTPSLHGEGAVLRILDEGKILDKLDMLHLQTDQLNTLDRLLSIGEGFIALTGPLGAGKTTTAYAILNQLNSRDRKIVTLEEKIETVQEDMTQVLINPEAGLTFSVGLESVLGQDPDVVLLDGPFDCETAEMALNAALQGQLVIATFQDPGPAECIKGLIDSGVRPQLVSDALRGVINQRLFKKVCESCSQAAEPDPEFMEVLGIPNYTGDFYVGSGCHDCHRTGFKGRVGLFEIMPMSREIRALLEKDVDVFDLYETAIDAGLMTMRQDGLRKASDGLVILEDVVNAIARD